MGRRENGLCVCVICGHILLYRMYVRFSESTWLQDITNVITVCTLFCTMEAGDDGGVVVGGLLVVYGGDSAKETLFIRPVKKISRRCLFFSFHPVAVFCMCIASFSAFSSCYFYYYYYNYNNCTKRLLLRFFGSTYNMHPKISKKRGS